MPQYVLRVTTPYGRLVRRIVFRAMNGREAETMAREISIDEPSELSCGGRALARWGGRIRDQGRPQAALQPWVHAAE